MKKRRVTTIIEEFDENSDIGTEIARVTHWEYWPADHFKSCMNYLISFFYKTDKRYSCTRTKLGKILSILAFKYAVKGVNIFDEPIRKYENCGTLINSTKFWPRDIYPHYPEQINDDKRKISIFSIKSTADIPNTYSEIGEMSSELMIDIKNVFCEFGAFSQKDLSDLLNPIVEYPGVCNEDGTINLDEIKKLDKYNFLGNKVVQYIFS